MATQEYDKLNTTRINLKMNNKTDADIIGKLESVENIQGYIKAIIRNDMEGEKTMKKFERITNELYGAKHAGYRIDRNAEKEVDEQLIRKLRAERGERFVDNKLDEIYDFDGDAYKDENGDVYAVVMVWIQDKEEPLCWHKLTEAQYRIKDEFVDTWGDDVNEDTIINGKDVREFAEEWEKPVGEIFAELELIDRTDICTILLNDSDTERQTIYYYNGKLWSTAEEGPIDTPKFGSLEEAEEYCGKAWGTDAWELEWIER